jgi:hypothetical protein
VSIELFSAPVSRASLADYSTQATPRIVGPNSVSSPSGGGMDLAIAHSSAIRIVSLDYQITLNVAGALPTVLCATMTIDAVDSGIVIRAIQAPAAMVQVRANGPCLHWEATEQELLRWTDYQESGLLAPNGIHINCYADVLNPDMAANVLVTFRGSLLYETYYSTAHLKGHVGYP